MWWLRVVCVSFALLATATTRAQEPVVTCRSCNSVGTFPCSKHGKDLGLEADPMVRRCSVAIECKVCGGALKVDCRQCRRPDVEAALAERQGLLREWLERQRVAVDDAVGHRTLVHLETTHCDLVCGIKPLMVGKVKFDTHQLAHLYGQRIEELRERFRTAFELTDDELPGRLRVYMFRDGKEHGVIGPRETGMGTAGSIGLKQMGPEFVYSMWQDPRSLADDEQLHRNIVHNVTHLLLSQMLPMRWIGNRSHGWLDEGIAHWFEDQVTGRCLNYCFEEVLVIPGSGWKNGKWRTPVRVMVDEGTLPSFAALSTKNTDQLTFEEHAASFAYVDFLLTTQGGAKFRDLVRAAKQGQATRDALQTIYQWNPLTIEAPFQAWVRATYPPPGR
ncbi:MAG: hypothetical protein JNM25_05275 [Planctomycetes bacterium]|nr:hypothetical protein [Planctomycetota bacterium]